MSIHLAFLFLDRTQCSLKINTGRTLRRARQISDFARRRLPFLAVRSDSGTAAIDFALTTVRPALIPCPNPQDENDKRELIALRESIEMFR